jgi:hypothetical protein
MSFQYNQGNSEEQTVKERTQFFGGKNFKFQIKTSIVMLIKSMLPLAFLSLFGKDMYRTEW